jgi:hypothetical protein
MNQETIDPRPVHIKLLDVCGKTHFVSVMWPSDQRHDETVWAHVKGRDTQRLVPFVYEGPSLLGGYSATKEQFA